VLNAIVATYIYTLVPEFLMRFLSWVLVNILYRIKVRGLENIPGRGPALIVSNHVSFMDALVIGGSVRRPVRYEPPAEAGDYDHALHVDHPEAPSFLEQYIERPQPKLGGAPQVTEAGDKGD